MSVKKIVFLSVLAFGFVVCWAQNAVCAPNSKVESPHDRFIREYRERTGKAAARKKQDEQSKSIWDDNSESNPYFKSSAKKAKTAKDLKEKEKQNEPRRSTFERRVYTGSSKDEIIKAAEKNAAENFKAFFTDDDVKVEYESVFYDVAGDTLSVANFRLVPEKKEDEKEKTVPYYLTVKNLTFRNFNIGEKDGSKMTENGEMKAMRVEIPVWDENAVKKGKIEIGQLKMTGNVPAYIKAGGKGKLDTVELNNFRSETIINETILNNVVRSKVFSASSALFSDVEFQKNFAEALKHQQLDGMEFASARIDGNYIPTLQGAVAAMTSYSARILNTDLVLGARLEAQKDKPVADMEQLKKNVEENKAAINAVEAEMKEK